MDPDLICAGKLIKLYDDCKLLVASLSLPLDRRPRCEPTLDVEGVGGGDDAADGGEGQAGGGL